MLHSDGRDFPHAEISVKDMSSLSRLGMWASINPAVDVLLDGSGLSTAEVGCKIGASQPISDHE